MASNSTAVSMRSGDGAGGLAQLARSRLLSLVMLRKTHTTPSLSLGKTSKVMRRPSLEEASCRDDGKTALGKSWSVAASNRAAS